MVSLLAVFGLGPGEMIFFGLIVVLLFGSRLPSVMRSLGQSVTSFKTGLKDEGDQPVDSIDEKSANSKK